MTSQPGHFIVVEGLEGAGKSSAMQAIKLFLESRVQALVTTHEPGGTFIGDSLRHLIKQPVAGEVLDPRAELLLLYASRVQLVEQVMRPALAQGSWVLSDRFELSTMAYQGGGRKIASEMINTLSQFCLNGFKPDLTIFLDVSPEQGLKRALARSKADRIEQESVDFFHAVYARYQQCIQSMDNVVVIDASEPMLVVQQKIVEALEQYMHSLNGVD